MRMTLKLCFVLGLLFSIQTSAQQYPQDYFNICWFSCPCTEYSKAKTRGIRDIEGANKLVLKSLEIINYFNPEYWYIENPQTSLLKKQIFMESLPFIDCD